MCNDLLKLLCFSRNLQSSVSSPLWLLECALENFVFSIAGVEWDPTQNRLALCTGNNKIYMWSATGCLSVEVPTEGLNWEVFLFDLRLLVRLFFPVLGYFSVLSLKWHSSGRALLLIGKDQMCVCFLSDTQQTISNSNESEKEALVSLNAEEKDLDESQECE